MLLFPQCRSYNPSLEAEPQACRYIVFIVCVCEWLYVRVVKKHFCTFVQNVISVFVFTCASAQLFVLSSRFEYFCGAGFWGWTAIGDQYRAGSSHFTWCVLLAIECKAELSKQPTHLGICHKLMGFVFFNLYITFHCTSSVICCHTALCNLSDITNQESLFDLILALIISQSREMFSGPSVSHWSCSYCKDTAVFNSSSLCLQGKNFGMLLYMETGTTASQNRSLMWSNSLLLLPVLEGPVGSSLWASASGCTGGERSERVWATMQVWLIIMSQPPVIIWTDILVNNGKFSHCTTKISFFQF